MNDEDVNRIIAEYMVRECYNCGEIDLGGCCFHVMYDDLSSEYTESLDALVPVWNKLRKDNKTEMLYTIMLFDYNGKPWNCKFEDEDSDLCVEFPSESAFKAAAYATAKAIREIK
jgi:hypothetical protein